MTEPLDTTDLIDRLAEIRALLGCAFMACTALPDEDHTDALQSLLVLIEGRVDAIGRADERPFSA